jgi:hypothetical protein
MTDSQRSLSTGMGNLDTKFAGGGLHPGSVVVVQTPPAALGQVVLYNLPAGRPTTYVSVGPCDEATRATLGEAGDLDPETLTVEQLPTADSPEAFRALLDGLELPPGGTVLVEPTNLLESSATHSQYATLLSMLAERVTDAGGLAGLLAVESDPLPGHRWLTLHEADTVLTVLHEVSTRSVHEHLALEKLHPRQDLQDNEDRVFRLPRSLEIDIDTKKNLSP